MLENFPEDVEEQVREIVSRSIVAVLPSII